MKKFRIKSTSGGIWGDGFFNGLEAAETYPTRQKVKEDEIEVPTTKRHR